ncbi:hypothetical protein PRIPAC_80698 [Pristionchus pacificus]|uniref:Uncharacterized protein n=1 Tax=Pristionchus pacificus TaxID=54126 RepID=A0A2A6CPF6_PRIPA|nr:hypothetical protein PRIPAC_80698 [Pristionchus pacificus]|eukprot:PDM80074.1 hypothetical protein PRIPAC_32653 [Pristionchus pacificus]
MLLSSSRVLQLLLRSPEGWSVLQASTRLKTGKNGTIFRNGLSLIQSKGLVFSPISRNRFRVTRKFPAFVETVRSNCLIPDTPSTRLFANTIDILRNRNALKYDPTKRIGYSILCKAARISMETDIRNHKERLIEKAIKEGKNLRKAKEKGHFMRKRMESRDESGEYSQAHTTKRAISTLHARFASIRVHDATQQLYTTPVELDGRKGKFTIDAVFQVGEKMFEAISVVPNNPT